MIEVKLNFIPIHKFRPEKQSFVNDKLGTDSTRLLATGKQRYLDQLRPKVLNYDQEAYDAYKAEEKAKQKLEDASTLQAGLDRMALQNAQSQNIIVDTPQIANPDIALNDQLSPAIGVDASNSVFSNTLIP